MLSASIQLMHHIKNLIGYNKIRKMENGSHPHKVFHQAYAFSIFINKMPNW